MYGSPVLLFFDISGGELLVILVVVFLVFGPEKMPEMARKAGRLMNQMKKASTDLTNEFKKETSVLKNEIEAAHSGVNQELESVRREVNNTRAQVLSSMNTETETTAAGDQQNAPADPEIPVSETSAGPTTESKNASKSE
jgi:Tat protein translocase TatB subunit